MKEKKRKTLVGPKGAEVLFACFFNILKIKNLIDLITTVIKLMSSTSIILH